MRQRHVAGRLERHAAPPPGGPPALSGQADPAALLQPLSGRHGPKAGSGEIAAVLDELRDCADPGGDPEGEAIATELGQAIRRFVRQLPPREGNLFVRRYFFTEPVAVAARHCGISENHAGVLLSRTRRKLRDHLRQEGFLHE